MNHPCVRRTDGQTDRQTNCDSICALSIYAVARKNGEDALCPTEWLVSWFVSTLTLCSLMKNTRNLTVRRRQLCGLVVQFNWACIEWHAVMQSGVLLRGIWCRMLHALRCIQHTRPLFFKVSIWAVICRSYYIPSFCFFFQLRVVVNESWC